MLFVQVRVTKNVLIVTVPCIFLSMDSSIGNIDDGPQMMSEEQDWIPRIGMEFDTLDCAFQFWKEGQKRGKKDEDDMIRHRSSSRTNCKARFKVFLDKEREKYIVKEFVEEHNHELQLPTTTHMLRSHRELTTAHALTIELASDSGLTPKVTQELMSREAGDRLSLGLLLKIRNHN
ncbi:protein FAR1-RELATED SEQUENCE 5-like [Tripterygium wilfordii]|uniref:protein FAR1-RELATED SEQUENCE 5-like n=1 Tax=Tripterygium wilfordii TaxID=458696 RepID=UPI0018F85842|nr:protein FAR1-RELATED SEQUENCE 5-like [Tripterygium wilfordii]